MHKTRFTSEQQGFSLIELMIVVAIIAVLSAVAVPQYQHYLTRAKWSVNLTQIEPVKLAIAECLQDSGDATSCDSAAELGLDTLPTPQHASAAITLAAANADELALTITGSTGAGACKVALAGSLSDGLLSWTASNVANGAAAACSRQLTGVGA
ncbi:MAG: prepilin-type N-terminal cleavage/methylation domain-containing protein [Perlucidibaca sp.]